MDDMSLDRRAYTGAPKLRNNIWPDELHPYHKHNWLWDAETARWSRLTAAGKARELKRKLTKLIVDTM
jgi:hypothetical protein